MSKMESNNIHCVKYLSEKKLTDLIDQSEEYQNNARIGLTIANVDGYPYERLDSLIRLTKSCIDDYTDTIQYINDKEILNKCDLLIRIEKDKLDFYEKLKKLLEDYKSINYDWYIKFCLTGEKENGK